MVPRSEGLSGVGVSLCERIRVCREGVGKGEQRTPARGAHFGVCVGGHLTPPWLRPMLRASRCTWSADR